MTNTESTKRTTLDIAKLQMQAELDFLGKKVESELKWLESEIVSLRRDMEKGNFYEANNLPNQAARVANYATRLKYAHEGLKTLELLEQDGAK